MVSGLIWLSFWLAFAAGLHGLTLLIRLWPHFVRMGGLGRFLFALGLGLGGQANMFFGRLLSGYRPGLGRRMRKRGRAYCDRFNRGVFNALLLPLTILSTIVAFWWARLAWMNLHPDAVSWWKMQEALDESPMSLALEFAWYYVTHVTAFWILHLWIAARLGVQEDDRA